MVDILGTIGRRSIELAGGAARFLCFLDDILMAMVHERGRGDRVLNRVFVLQIYFTGVQALPMLSVLAVAIGIATTLTAVVTLTAIGATDYIGWVIATIVVRELAPIITAVIVIARSCTAISAELGSMSIEQEINAMKAMRINHVRLIVVPRVFGVAMSMLCLTAYFALVSILAGYAASSLVIAFPLETFLREVVAAIRPIDLAVCLAKAAVFGTIVPVLACYYGLSAQYSSTQIPQMTTKATIQSLVWCFVAGFLITLLTH